MRRFLPVEPFAPRIARAAVMAAAAFPAGVSAAPGSAPEAASLEAPAGPAHHASSPALAALIADADRWLLSGQAAPADILARLSRLEPPDRLVALAYLRRLGIYDGPAVSTDVLLGPAEVAP